ncbi:hypothetical protein [Rhodococcoides fascians]|uniref:hypothetical protein n=1 Tax=Rhodococcoides fascians TaxID=1828 RepID=UPI0007AACDC7|nr:hypothetical protein [Rhodococcus fascians]AMY54369.1 hypothetical protein A3L23_03036 [Rhodococcus fascians D188]
MDAGTWLTLAALVVAILAVPATILATRHWGNRRARLDVEIDAIPLLPEGVRTGLLEVTYRDIPVRAPHLVIVTLRNSGPRDLASGMFDNGRSITVKFDQTFYGLTAVNGGVQTISPGIGARANEAIVCVKPALLKRGSSWSFSAVTTGPVEVNVDAPLIDTDVRAVASNNRGGTEITLRLSVLGITAEVPLRRGSNRR